MSAGLIGLLAMFLLLSLLGRAVQGDGHILFHAKRKTQGRE